MVRLPSRHRAPWQCHLSNSALLQFFAPKNEKGCTKINSEPPAFNLRIFQKMQLFHLPATGRLQESFALSFHYQSNFTWLEIHSLSFLHFVQGDDGHFVAAEYSARCLHFDGAISHEQLYSITVTTV
jgi:hypothetical protein